MPSLAEILLTIPQSREYESLGRFVASCSSVEISLHAIARQLMGIDEDLARLLVGEPRVGDLMKFIKDVSALKGIDSTKRKALFNALDWASYTNRVRSVVAHKPMHMQNKKMIFHNSVTARFRKKSWFYECLSTELDECSTIAFNTASVISDVMDQLRLFPIELPIYEKQKASLQKLGLPTDPQTIQDPIRK
jgi:hypothetical protein